jgi:flagellar assembly protein FliH
MEQARRDGFANGLATAHQEAEQAIAPAIQKLADQVAQVARMRDAMREQATDDLVRLALAIASRVTHRDVAVDPVALAGLVRAAFAKLRSQEISVAHIHPGLEPILRRCLEPNGIPANLYVLSDAKLAPGRLAFETDSATESAPDDSPSRGSYADVDLSEIERGLTDKLAKT